MVHSFTCAGILPTQYIKLCNFSMIGTVGQKYIRKGIVIFRLSASCIYVASIMSTDSIHRRRLYRPRGKNG